MEVVSTIDSAYAVHFCTAMHSLFESNKGEKFNVHLLYDGLEDDEKNKLLEFFKSHRQKLFLYKVSGLEFKDFPIRAQVTVATYFRLLIPTTLPSTIGKVIYLDYDIVVNSNLQKLWKHDLAGKIIGAVRTGFSQQYPYLEMPNGLPYFNAGIMLMDLKLWKESRVTESAVTFIKENPDKLLNWDQDALNRVLIGQWGEIDSKWNILDSKKKVAQEGIIHFAGVHKPWDIYCTHPLKDLYLQNRKKTPWGPMKTDLSRIAKNFVLAKLRLLKMNG